MAAPEASGGHATRRGHSPHLSISDPSHHVTEAIGHMYDDDYDPNDPRRLSYIPSANSESITTIPRQPLNAQTLSPASIQTSPAEGQSRQTKGNPRPPLVGHRSFDRDSDAGSDSNRTPSETATSSFPLNDIGYESNPAAVAQELNNLAAIRRMSMDVAAAGDPDLPSFGGSNNNLSIPSLPPSPSADENDASRLFWVPASLHPELAPKEFKSFLESKADLIKRKSGDYSSLSPERSGSDSGLRRKRSMLSKQIDSSSGYTDGAERLERQRSQTSSKRDGMLSPNLQELETLVDDSKTSDREKEILARGLQNLAIRHSLRRSTRTQYRKGSLKKGEKPPYSKRVGRGLSESADAPPKITLSDKDPARSSVDSATPGLPQRASSSSSRSTAYVPGSTTSSTFDTILDRPEAEQTAASQNAPTDADSDREDPSIQGNVASYARQWHSRISSNGRSTLNIPPSAQSVPAITESPPNDSRRGSSASASLPSRVGERDGSSAYSPKAPQQQDTTPTKRTLMSDQHGRETTPTLNDFANNPQMIPGNSTRTDSLSFIPTIHEERKPEERSEEKDKKKDKDGEPKRSRSRIADIVHSSTRPDPPQPPPESSTKGRESIAIDRLDPKLEEERRKDNARRASADKKEKDGIFSSIFGGARKKHSGDGHHRKNSSRNYSPDPPMRQLKRAIYRMAHIKLANPRRALYSQVLLSNFMYSYLEKVQQMHPQMMVASGSQRKTKSRDQQDEYMQYQQYQEAHDQHYGDNGYDDPSMYEYDDDPRDRYHEHGNGHHGYENGHGYGSGHYSYDHSSFGDDVQLDDDDDDDMW
ncbi:hypothetical protein N7470_004327 [Penicillium chermesinum]|nr:hypothetical protein N7470_004327 [Penicillium chermesinum]